MPTFREDQARIQVSVAGVTMDSAPWTTFQGGDAEAQNVNTRPGGMQPAIELGGPINRSDVTVERLYSDVTHGWYPQLDAVCGKASMWASYTPLDANGNPVGATITYTGILKTVTRPNADANATGAQHLSLVMGANQNIATTTN